MGKWYDDVLEEQMTTKCKEAIEDAGGRTELAEILCLDRDIIDGIANRREYKLSPTTFERIFGCKLKRSEPLEEQPVETTVKHKIRKTVNVEIRCPGFDELVRLLEASGRGVRVVYK